MVVVRVVDAQDFFESVLIRLSPPTPLPEERGAASCLLSLRERARVRAMVTAEKLQSDKISRITGLVRHAGR
jgi:hypothetical protein